MQALFTPDSGSSSATAGDIGSDITSFFDSFSSLESDPTNNALREQVLSSASTLAGDISSAASSLNAQSAAIDQEAIGRGEPGELADQRDRATESGDSVHVAGRGCGNARGSAAAGPEPAFATDRDQPGDDGEQRPVDHDDLGAVAGLRRAELPADHGNGERSHGLFSGRNGYHFATGLGRRAAGRVSDGAGRGHSRRAQLARSTGVQHLDLGECAEQCGHGSGWRDGNGGQSALHLQRAGAGGGKRGGDERDR